MSQRGGAAPRWGPDGRTIYYLVGSQLFAADVQAGSEFRAANRRPLVRLARYGFGDVNRVDYDIHPDGKRFVLLKPKRSERQGITVVLNWFEEMKARLGGGTRER